MKQKSAQRKAGKGNRRQKQQIKFFESSLGYFT